MSLENVLARCATINASISGVSKAYSYDDVPESLQSGNLPAVVPAGVAGDLSYYASEGARSDHEISFYLYVAARARAPLAQQLASAIPFVKKFRDRYAQAVRLDDLADVSHAELHRYVLTGDMEFEPGVQYVGVIFSLRVVEKEAVTVGG